MTHARSSHRSAKNGLAQRLTLVFGLVIALFVAAVLAINVQTQQRLLTEGETLNIDHLLRLTKEVSSPHLLAGNPAALEIFFEELLERDDILSVFLIDAQGLVFVAGSYDETPFLSTPDDPLIVRARETGIRQIDMDLDKATQEIAGPIYAGDQLIGILRISLSNKGLRQGVRTVFISNLALGLVFFFIAISVSSVLASRLTDPLTRLTAVARKVTDGDLNQTIDIRSNDEIGILADGLNTMLQTVRTSMSEVHRVAYEDRLTGIPNRSWLNARLEQIVQHHADKTCSFAVMFLDIDNFKMVNDTHGHHVGDLLLQGFARRLARCAAEKGLSVATVDHNDALLVNVCGTEAILTRLGGDEFTLILPSHLAKSLAASIVEAMRKPFRLDGTQLPVSTSIGIALFPDHAVTREHLLKCADVAMYQAKHAGRNTVRFYDHESHELLKQRSRMERDLERAVENDAFDLALQPQFHVQTGQVMGVEALIRWHHPQRGAIAPDEFLPVAACMGLLPKIGDIMMDKAVALAASINADRQTPLTVAVNVAVEDLSEEGFADGVAHLLDRHQARAQWLEIEITEGTAMDQNTHVEKQMAALRDLGVRFALDDFGMGYSNLGRLNALAFETLKIDRSLIDGIHDDANAQGLLKTVLDMADAIGANVVAEGVETADQLAFLRSTGCECYQGYLGGRPMPADAFLGWLARQDGSAADRDALRHAS